MLPCLDRNYSSVPREALASLLLCVFYQKVSPCLLAYLGSLGFLLGYTCYYDYDYDNYYYYDHDFDFSYN